MTPRRLLLTLGALVLTIAALSAQVPLSPINPRITLTPPATACTTTAASVSQAAVSTAVSAAADGDIVCIPSGSATWSTGITINNKAINIRGAGVDTTTITLSGTTNFVEMSGTSAGSNIGQVSNLTVTGAGNGNDGFLQISSTYRFRLHHLKITATANRDILIVGSYGVIDHLTVNTSNGSNAVQILGGQFTPTGRWSVATAWGSADQVYIEDSAFTSTNCNTGLGPIDGFNGSKIVFRHNTVTNQQSYVHGYDSASESALQTEIYENLFDMQQVNCPIDRMVFIRGGTGYAYNNTMHLTDAYNNYSPAFLSLYYYREGSTQQGSICNGSSGIDGNSGSPAGYPCWQQPGMGGGATGGINSVPWYAFNNVGTGGMSGHTDVRSEAAHVIINRDYFDNTARPGYTPYSYPHPYQSLP